MSSTNEPGLRAELAALKQGAAGYYVLEFTDGQCYVGQSKNLPHRIGNEHRTTYNDIKRVRVIVDAEA